MAGMFGKVGGLSRSHRRRAVALVVGLLGLCAPSLAAAADTDRVVLRNGDRIAGEIENLRSGKLELSTTAMGTIYVEWDKVVELVSPSQFEIETTRGTRYYGSIRGGTPGMLTDALSAGTVDLDVLSVVRIQPIKVGFLDRFDGLIDLGEQGLTPSDVRRRT